MDTFSIGSQWASSEPDPSLLYPIMAYRRQLRIPPVEYGALQAVPSFKARLTSEQLDALRRCANGISLRFDKSEVVDALVLAGYVVQGVAGVVSVTAEGQEHLLDDLS